MNSECPICLDDFDNSENNFNEVCELKCNHQFHLECLKNLYNTKCPLCRENFDEPEDVVKNIRSKTISGPRELGGYIGITSSGGYTGPVGSRGYTGITSSGGYTGPVGSRGYTGILCSWFIHQQEQEF